jgi:hypothetical protein
MAETKSFQLDMMDEGAWATLAEMAEHEGPCRLDLSDVETITPAGAVGIVLMTRSRRRRYTNIILPPKKGRATRYLKLIDFFHLTRAYGHVRFDRVVDYGRGTLGEISFTKLLMSDSPDYDSVHTVIHHHFETAYPDTANELKVVFSEVLTNIHDHAGSEEAPPFHCVQVQTSKSGLQLTFGDLGVGFRASLARNPRLGPFDTEADALEGAIVHGHSGRSHINASRGGGLKRALDHVLQLNGRYRAVSRDGLAVSSPVVESAFSALEYAFPGVIVGINIPTS